jgi:hypothetical protein
MNAMKDFCIEIKALVIGRKREIITYGGLWK